MVVVPNPPNISCAPTWSPSSCGKQPQTLAHGGLNQRSPGPVLCTAYALHRWSSRTKGAVESLSLRQRAGRVLHHRQVSLTHHAPLLLLPPTAGDPTRGPGAHPKPPSPWLINQLCRCSPPPLMCKHKVY